MLSASVLSAAKQAPAQTRPATFRTNRTNCLCPKTHSTANERKASAMIAQRTSPPAQLNEIRRCNAKSEMLESEMPKSEMPKSEHAREARNFPGCRSRKECTWANPPGQNVLH